MAQQGGFYDVFGTRTGEGRVLTDDLSTQVILPATELLAEERGSRQRWINTKTQTQFHYLALDFPVQSTRLQLLNQRVVAPKLTVGKPKNRGTVEHRLGRRYPPRLAIWHSYQHEVQAFTPDDGDLPSNMCLMHVFRDSISDNGIWNGEEPEKAYQEGT